MAIPTGRCYIVCSKVSHYYGTLALQHKPEDGSVTLIPFGSESGTLWKVTTNHDGTQVISPDAHPDLQTVNMGGIVKALSAQQNWIVKKTDGLHTISDGTAFWACELVKQDDGMFTPVPGGDITVASPSETVVSEWWCLPVPTC